MDKRFWTFISYILHPLFMPTLGTFIVLWNDPAFIALNYFGPWLIMLGSVFACTVLLPLIFSWALLKMGRISSIEQPTENDRRMLMVFAEMGFLVTYIGIHNIPEAGRSLSLFMLGINVAMLATLAASFIKRISFHATGAGGILGTVIGLAYYTRLDLKYWICGAVVLAWFAGFARYRLKAHDTFEIYLGYIVGILSLALTFIIGAK
jgi:hypothetical protein